MIAAATAGAVVAVGHPSGGGAGTVKAAGPAGPATAGPTTGGPAPATAATTTTSAAPTTSAPPPPPPKPSVTGSVSGGRHSGDVRFFLTPVPSGASVIGDVNGKTLTKDDVVAAYDKASDVGTILNELGFKDGAYRDYQTADAKYHVITRLYRFGDAGGAQTWIRSQLSGDDGTPFDVPGYEDARTWAYPVDKESGLAHIRGMYSVGDIAFEILVIGEDPLDKGSLTAPLGALIKHLKTGA